MRRKNKDGIIKELVRIAKKKNEQRTKKYEKIKLTQNEKNVPVSDSKG